MSIPFNAISTMFRGVNMKSRLEADIAFLIDGLGYEWLYEPQSYLLDSGIHYLPDFHVPKLKLFIECRGYWTEKGQKQIEGFGKMINQGKISGDYLVIGPEEVMFMEPFELFGTTSFSPAYLVQCKHCGKYFFLGEGGYKCRYCGEWDGNNHIKDWNELRFKDGKLIIGDWFNVVIPEFVQSLRRGGG